MKSLISIVFGLFILLSGCNAVHPAVRVAEAKNPGCRAVKVDEGAYWLIITLECPGARYKEVKLTKGR